MCISRIFYDISYVFQYPCPSTHIGSLELIQLIQRLHSRRYIHHKQIQEKEREIDLRTQHEHDTEYELSSDELDTWIKRSCHVDHRTDEWY